MPPAVLLRLVAQVRRRVVLGSLLRVLVWAWVAALATSALWVVVQRLTLPSAPIWLCATVPVVLLVGATLAAVLSAVLRAPSPLGAAMSLDQRFGLRERVTTTLTLDADSAATPAGQALIADVEERANQVRVADRFPVTVPWKPAAALPVCCGAFVLLALLLPANFGKATTEDDPDGDESLEASKAVEEQMKKLAQNKPAVKKGEEQPKAEDLARIEAEIEQFTQKPRERRDQIQDRIKDATAIEEELKRQQKQQEKRADAMRDALRQSAERLKRKNKDKDQQGMGKDAKDALARGDVQRARDEMQRLSRELEKEEQKERLKKKLQDPNLKKEEKEELERELDKLEKEGKGLDDKDREDLEKQLAEMQEMVERLTKKEEDLKKELAEEKEKEKNEEDPDKKEEHRKNQEELERELEEMQKNPLTEEEKKELQELSEQLKECKECMGKEGKDGKEGKNAAAKKMAKAAQKMGQMGKEGDKQERARMLARMQAARKAMSRQMQQGGPGGPAAGKRPEQKDDNTGEDEQFLPGDWDKGKAQVVGQGPKGGKKFDGPRKPSEMKEEIKQASQEATSAVDRQRLPPSARKMTRDYFEKMRDKDKEAAKEEKK